MRIVLPIFLVALFSSPSFGQAPAASPRAEAISPPPGKEESLKQKARNFWIKSKGYLSEDPQTFSQGAQQTLAELGRDIDMVAAKTDVGRPPYFETRLQSLRQQHEHLSQKLQELTPDAIKSRTNGPRYAFDQCIDSLEKAVDQAENEADVLAKVKSPEKRDIK